MVGMVGIFLLVSLAKPTNTFFPQKETPILSKICTLVLTRLMFDLVYLVGHEGHGQFTTHRAKTKNT